MNGKLYPDPPEAVAAVVCAEGKSLRNDLNSIIFKLPQGLPDFNKARSHQAFCAALRARLSVCLGEETNASGRGESKEPPASAHVLLWPEHHGQRPRHRGARRFRDGATQSPTRPGEYSVYLLLLLSHTEGRGLNVSKS